MPNSKCQTCGEPLLGRTDKKFCSDQCRSIHNQIAKQNREAEVNLVNKVLQTNRRILRRLCPTGNTVVEKSALDTLGYNPKYFTSIFVTSQKQIYYICYDYAFTPIVTSNIKKALIVLKRRDMQFNDPWVYARSQDE